MTKIERCYFNAVAALIVGAFWSYMLWLVREPFLAAILSVIDFVFVLPINLMVNYEHKFWLTDHVDAVYWVLFVIFYGMCILCAVCEIGAALYMEKPKR